MTDENKKELFNFAPNEAQSLAGDSVFQCVAFSIGESHYGIDIMSVREIRNWTGVTELPNTVEYVRGVINLRGVIVPIIDLKARFGQGLITPTPSHVVVIVAIGERLHGLLVDSVSDILTVKHSDISPIPESLGQSQSELLKGLVSQGETMMAIMSLNHLVIESVESNHLAKGEKAWQGLAAGNTSMALGN